MGEVEPIHHSIPTQQVGELRDVRRDASCLICTAQRHFIPAQVRDTADLFHPPYTVDRQAPELLLDADLCREVRAKQSLLHAAWGIRPNHRHVARSMVVRHRHRFYPLSF